MSNIQHDFAPWFDDFTKEQLLTIENSHVSLTYNKGEIICKQGGFASHVIFLKKGLIKIYKEYNDKNLILKIAKPGEFIGLSSLYQKGIFGYSGACIDTAEVFSVNIEVFKQMINDSNTFGEKVITQLNNDTNQFFDRVLSLTQKQLHGRIADIILHLAKDVYQSNKFNLLMTRRDIAEFCGMSTESAIRIMKEFHNDKIIKIEGKNLEIVSYKLLERLSQIG